jgi:hypothetical protein
MPFFVGKREAVGSETDREQDSGSKKPSKFD